MLPIEELTVFSADIETIGFLPVLRGKKDFHVFSLAEHDPDNMMKVTRKWSETNIDEAMKVFADPSVILIMHNGYAFDGPAMEKMTGEKVQCEIIDTLFLSWYLYPKMIKHGLAAWGEELGIKKPDIDDWENLTLAEYVHRCEEDVRIQEMLWRQMWKHLILLYGSPEKAMHLVRHLSFKAKQAAMQAKARWKLDQPQAEAYVEDWTDIIEEATASLELGMPQVPVYAKKSRPKKPYKMSGELSATGLKWFRLLESEGKAVELWKDPSLGFVVPIGDDVNFNEEIKVCTGYKEPNAGSHSQMKDWLWTLGWVPESFKYDRNKETGDVRQIPQIKNQDTGELCDSIIKLIEATPALKHLEKLSIVKHRLSVVKGFLKHVDQWGYVQALIQGLTNTLRFKHKVCLNLPSTRKLLGKEIRGLLTSRDVDKFELCGSDLASVEDRTKQHYMWPHDPNYVLEMQGDDFDPHCDMAIEAGMMTVEEAEYYKAFDKEAEHTPQEWAKFNAIALIRHGGKTTNYAATYLAGAATIARAAGVPERTGEKLHAAYWSRNWSIKAIADGCETKKSRGMSWLWNPVAKIWFWLKAEKDKFSTLNQSTATYCFDRWVFYIVEKRPQLTGQFHDEVIVELPLGNREGMTKILKGAIKSVNDELRLNRELDCDVDFGYSYADIH